MKRKGHATLAICNVISSSIAQEADGGIYLHAGPEIGVASTKEFTTQLAGMLLVAVTVALWWRASDLSSVPWGLVPLTWLWADATRMGYGGQNRLGMSRWNRAAWMPRGSSSGSQNSGRSGRIDQLFVNAMSCGSRGPGRR